MRFLDPLTAPVHMHTALSVSKIWLIWIPLGERHFGAIRPKPLIPLQCYKGTVY